MEFQFQVIYGTALHTACKERNALDAIKYIVSLNKIDLSTKNIF